MGKLHIQCIKNSIFTRIIAWKLGWGNRIELRRVKTSVSEVGINYRVYDRSKKWLVTRAASSASLLFILLLTGCSSFQSEEQSIKQTEIKGTELEVHVRQTIAAQKPADHGVNETIVAQQATLEAQAALATSSTQPGNVPSLDQTSQVMQSTQLAIETANASQMLTQAPPSIPEEDVNAFMKTANILLYEDMIGQTNTTRYVKRTLDMMGLTYKDDGSAQGWFNQDIGSGAPNGKPWDLVIIAAEDKESSPAEFFNYANKLIDQGASVILEVWDLDKIAQGTAQTLLSRCGVHYQLDWFKIPPARQVMFTLAPDHPVLREPNSGLTFTRNTDFWWDANGKKAYDIGDLMQIAPGGDSVLLLGTKADDKTGHGTLTVCLGGQLILQTFSSHSLDFEIGGLLWQNYIFNALKTRMLGRK